MTRPHILLYLAPEGWWMEDHAKASDAAECLRLFGLVDIPTPFRADIDAERVKAVLAELHPDDDIIIAGTEVLTLDTSGWPLIVNRGETVVATFPLPEGSAGDDRAGLEQVRLATWLTRALDCAVIEGQILDIHRALHETARNSCADAVQDISLTLPWLAERLGVTLPSVDSYRDESEHDDERDDAYERAAARARTNDFAESGGKDWT